MKLLRAAGLAVVVCVLSGLTMVSAQNGGAPRATATDNGHFTFALIGDMPYGPEGDLKFPNTRADINADRTLSFVVHDGDIKNGSSLCDDPMFDNRLELFNGFNAPLIYVPGDNEWTDCHRANNGAFDPIERLTHLRTLFYPDDLSLGRKRMLLERQSAEPQYALYRENVRWTVHGVLFVGLHIVGSNNNLGRTPVQDVEYAARNAANLAWLHDSFDLAHAEGAKAVMLIIQANPGFELAPAARTGFNDFLAALQGETLGFDGPVVLVHGDSHYFRVDKPMLGARSNRRIENFTRVETFGENDNHWLHVSVDPGNPNGFVFDQRIVQANLVQH